MMEKNMLCSESWIKNFLVCGRYVFNNNWNNGLQPQKMSIVLHYCAHSTVPCLSHTYSHVLSHIWTGKCMQCTLNAHTAGMAVNAIVPARLLHVHHHLSERKKKKTGLVLVSNHLSEQHKQRLLWPELWANQCYCNLFCWLLIYKIHKLVSIWTTSNHSGCTRHHCVVAFSFVSLFYHLFLQFC